MMKFLAPLLVIVSLLCPSPAAAQAVAIDHWTHALPTATERQVADLASWGTVVAAVALDTKASWDSTDRGRAFKLQAVRLGITIGAAQLVKVLTHRDRPCTPSCGIDSPNSSFYSLHTALAFQTLGGPRLTFALPLSISTGGLRIAAGKHWLTDVLVGAAAGAATSRIR
jgi:hypothetical protein